VVGCITGSRGGVPGERKPVKRNIIITTTTTTTTTTKLNIFLCFN
jgi:hypothetical protein